MKLLEHLHITLGLLEGKKSIRTSIVWDENSNRYTDRLTEGLPEAEKEEYSEVDYFEEEDTDYWSLAILCGEHLYEVQSPKGQRLLRSAQHPLTVWSRDETIEEPIAEGLMAEVEVESVETAH